VDDHPTDTNDSDLEWIYWLTLAAQLPTEGVRSAFPTEADCLQRLQKVRWTNEQRCEHCGSNKIVSLATRPVFQCQNCRRQFSVTSGTTMHRSHLPPTLWFAGAELLIRTHAYRGGLRHVINREMADCLGVEYEAGWRMNKKLLADLTLGGPGLLRKAICVTSPIMPSGTVIGSADHLNWLLEQE
jgi:hypothetical protein